MTKLLTKLPVTTYYVNRFFDTNNQISKLGILYMPKRYKIREILSILKKDGWILLRQKGSHKQFAHPIKTGVVTVSCHSLNDDLHPKTAQSIFKQARIRK